VRQRTIITRRGPARAAAGVAAAVALACAWVPAWASGITVTAYPPPLVPLDGEVTVAWAEPVDARLHFGRVPGVYTDATSAHGVGSLSFTPSSEGMTTGLHYCVLRAVGGPESSGEFGFAVESATLPVPTRPPNGSVVHETTTVLSWDPVEGVPYYHVAVSDSDIEIVVEDGQTKLRGANIVWQAITSARSIQYGAVDPSGHFVNSNGQSPPLMRGFNYRWLVLNNYGNHPLLTSLVGAGLAGFTVDVVPGVTAPALLAPADSLSIVDDAVEFAWEPVAGAVGYHLYIYQRRAWGGGEASYPVWNGPASVPGAVVHAGSFLSTGEYSWRVVALDQNGRGAASELRRFAYSTETGAAAISTVAADGRPVAQALVEISHAEGGLLVLPTVTDASGHAFKLLAPSAYAFHATKPGFRDTTLYAQVAVNETVHVPIVMRRPSARLRGTVLDSLGQPVFDATVVSAGNGSSVETATDGGGHFAVQLEAGTWEVHAEKQGYASSAAQIVTLEAGDYTELEGPLVVAGTPGSVTGTVVNPSGTPVVGATVWAENGGVLCPATTGSGGRFTLTLAPGQWTVWAERTGFRPSAPRTVVVNPGAGTTINPAICLVPLDSAIMGRVTDGQVAIAGARVTASPLSGSVVETTTNGQGEFVLVPPPGRYALSAAAAGYASGDPFHASTEGGVFYTGLEVPVRPLESAVHGTVLNGQSPVAGALVKSGSTATVTDATGAFSLPLPRGLHVIQAGKPGHFPTDAVTLTTRAGQTLHGLELPLAPGASRVSGRVTSQGSPVAWARVRASSEHGPTDAIATADGMYEIFVEAGEWTLVADATGFEPSAPATVLVAPAQSATGIDLALGDAWPTVSGTVRDAQGVVVAASIAISAENGAVPLRTSSSSDGSFSVRVRPGRAHALEVSAPLHGSRSIPVPPLQPGGAYGVDAVLPRWTGSVRGRALDDAGHGIAGARVVAAWADSSSTRTARDGRFVLWLDDGLYDVRVESPGRRSAFAHGVEVVSGIATELNPVLHDEFAEVEGTVSDAFSGAPLHGVLVTTTSGEGASAVSDGAGRYRMERVAPGETEIRFSKPGCRPRVEPVVVVPETSLGLDVELLVLAGSIAGRVHDGEQGIAGASVRAKLNGSTAAAAVTDEEGLYLLGGLDEDERYSVHASKDGHCAGSDNPLTETQPGTLDADFVMLPADATISGRVLDGTTMEPLPLASAEASDGLGHFGAAISDGEGRFTIAGLASAAPYTVSARHFGYVTAAASGVAPNTQDLEILLPRNYARISGSVVVSGPDVDPGAVRVVATSTSFAGVSRQAVPDGLGSYEIDEIRPGPYVISVSAPGCVVTPAQAPVELGEGAELTSLDFVVERVAITTVEVGGPVAVKAGSVVVFAGDALTEGGRLVEADLVWSVSPGIAGTIESPEGRFVCAPDYLGEITVRAAAPPSGAIGRFSASVYVEITSATQAVYRDSTGMLLRVRAGAVATTRSVFLAHEWLPDAKRFWRDFEVVGPGYRLKPDGLAFAAGREPELVLPSQGRGTGIATWDRTLLQWVDRSAAATADGLETPVAALGEYAVVASSGPLSVSDVMAEPDPFSPDNGPVTISYRLSSDEARMPFVTVTLYNLAGRAVRRLVEADAQGKGRQSVQWDGLTDGGEEARNGRYVVEVRAKDAGGEAAVCATLVLVK